MNARTDQIKHYNPVFDLFRGVAAMMVLFAHLKLVVLTLLGYQNEQQYHYPFFELFGFWGVEIFFALSGVLLGPILYRLYHDPDFKQSLSVFLRRRWYRTLPTY